MKLYKTEQGIVIEQDGLCYCHQEVHWDMCINRDDLYLLLQEEIKRLSPAGDSTWLAKQKIVAPIGSQEVWAAGVTYLRSKAARIEESRDSGGASFYDKVYEAERPELFYKASAHRVAGTNDFVRIRKDSSWNVPEPELTLVITSTGKIIGYTIGNDMSSRSIEGENPLYLPQAKVYERSAALGPCILVTENTLPSTTSILMLIQRAGTSVFEGCTTISQMKRTYTELVEYLYRECVFPHGCYLMTGTCVVPDAQFTLQSGDRVLIDIEPIGTLVNTVQ